MLEAGFGTSVMEDGRLVGIISIRDLVRVEPGHN